MTFFRRRPPYLGKPAFSLVSIAAGLTTRYCSSCTVRRARRRARNRPGERRFFVLSGSRTARRRKLTTGAALPVSSARTLDPGRDFATRFDLYKILRRREGRKLGLPSCKDAASK